MEEIKKVAKLTGYKTGTVKVYFRLVYWGLDRRDASRIARALEYLGISNTFANGLPWWLPKPKIEASLLVTLASGIGYILTYIT